MSAKRSHAALTDTDRPTISIQVEGDEVIHGVDLQLLTLLSSCARGLPADAACWDLSQLLVEGQPVQRATVLQWLNTAYQYVYGTPFVEPQQQNAAVHTSKRRRQQPAQAASLQQANPQQQQPPPQEEPGTFTSMARLLLFADAVDCAPPLLRACAAGVGKLLLRVQLPAGPLDLSVSTAYTWDTTRAVLYRLTEQLVGVVIATFESADFPSVRTTLRQQVQAQTEVLLYAAYKLQLAEVAAAVQEFVRLQSSFANSVLRAALRPVLSQRVLDAAAGYRSLQETLLLNHILTRPCALKHTPNDIPPATHMLAPVNLTQEQQQPVTFTAELAQDALGSSRGQRVSVGLQLFEGKVSIQGLPHIACVLLGPRAETEAGKQALLGPLVQSS